MPPAPAITTDPKLAIERAFVALLLADPALAAGIDIVAASDRDVLVGPLHAFVLCTDFTPVTRGTPNGNATVAIGLVTDMDDHGEAVRQDWRDRVLTALTAAPQPAPDYLTGCKLIAWSLGAMKEDSNDRKVMDVVPLRVAACAS